MRYTPEGKAVTELRVANTEQPEAEFHDLVAYGRLAEILGEHLRKGAMVFVSGRRHGQSGKAQDGSHRHGVVVIAESVQFLGRSGQAAQS